MPISASSSGSSRFSASTAVLLVREQRRSARRERALRAEIAALRGADDLATLLMGSERQLLVSWQGRDGEPRFEGDPTIVGDGAPAQRALAFGTWLAAGGRLDGRQRRSNGCKQRGEAFRLTARTTHDRFIDVEGRTIGGRALLRLRDVTGDRADLLLGRSELTAARGDLRAMTSLLDAVAHPLWIRDGDERIGLGEPGLSARGRGLRRRRRHRALGRTARPADARRGGSPAPRWRDLRSSRPGRRGRPALRPRRGGAADRQRQRRHRRRRVGTGGGADRSSASDGRPASHPRSTPHRGGDFRRQPEPDLQQRRLSASVESRRRLPRFAADRQRSARSPPRRAQTSRTGRFPRLEGRHPVRLSHGRVEPDLVAPARPAHASGRDQSRIPQRRRHLSVR